MHLDFEIKHYFYLIIFVVLDNVLADEDLIAQNFEKLAYDGKVNWNYKIIYDFFNLHSILD